MNVYHLMYFFSLHYFLIDAVEIVGFYFSFLILIDLQIIFDLIKDMRFVIAASKFEFSRIHICNNNSPRFELHNISELSYSHQSILFPE